MRSSSRDITTTLEMFMKLVDRAKNGTPPGRGWGIFPNTACPACGFKHVAVAMIGSLGYECPYCDYVDLEWVWLEHSVPGDVSYLLPVGWEHSRLCRN